MKMNKKLWQKVYEMIKEKDTIRLDRETIKKIYSMIHEETGMCVDDINIFVLEAVTIVASDIIADHVLRIPDEILLGIKEGGKHDSTE